MRLYATGFMVVCVSLALSVNRSSAQSVETSLVHATRDFLKILDDEQKAKAALPFEDESRTTWHYFPMERKGISFKELKPDQQIAALEIIKTGLSVKGYEKASGIRVLEEILREMEGDSDSRDPNRYHITIFGEPSFMDTWGLKYEGHHLSLNWTIVKGQTLVCSPRFFGANPGKVSEGAHQGMQLLKTEEMLALALVRSLQDSQKKQAIVSDTAPPEILTGAERKAERQKDEGIAFKDLRPDQQTMLNILLQEYLGAMTDSVAQRRMSEIKKAGMDDIRFVWMGGTREGEGQYYRIQGPTFIVEYDNTQNNANHIHTVWRDFDGDFGLDLLALHYQQYHQVNDVKTSQARETLQQRTSNSLVASLMGIRR